MHTHPVSPHAQKDRGASLCGEIASHVANMRDMRVQHFFLRCPQGLSMWDAAHMLQELAKASTMCSAGDTYVVVCMDTKVNQIK